MVCKEPGSVWSTCRDQNMVSPFHCFHKKLLLSAEAGPQSALSHWLVASVAPRSPSNSGEPLTVQISLPDDSYPTIPALPKDNPAGKGQPSGPRAQWPGLKHPALYSPAGCQANSLSSLRPGGSSENRLLTAHNPRDTLSASLKLFLVTPNSILLSGMGIIQMFHCGQRFLKTKSLSVTPHQEHGPSRGCRAASRLHFFPSLAVTSPAARMCRDAPDPPRELCLSRATQ